jgi:HEPN domain-containing protein
MQPETTVWVEDAEYDLQSAEVMLDSGRYFFVVFMCHLTIEKLLKAVIVERQGIVPPKTHNLVGLVTRAGLTVPAERRPLLNELDNMSVVTRYPDGRRAIASTLTAENTTSLYTRTVEFAQWLKHTLTSSPPSDVTPKN